MRIAIVADVFPPLRSSGAVQLRDLSLEFVQQGHQPTVLVATPGLPERWLVEMWNGVRIVRLRAPLTKDVGYLRRAIGEFMMPFVMLNNFRKSPVAAEAWNGVVWYSPTIFLGPLASALMKSSKCRGYLIVRDLFPDWAVDMGLMRKSLPYWLLKAVEAYQYSVADVIGVQTPGNLAFFDRWTRARRRHVEVLQNWLAAAPNTGCSISVETTVLSGRKIFVYAGNMGIAQGMGILLDLAESLMHRTDVGFLFVGRGSDVLRLRSDAVARGLTNVIFFDEIDPAEIPGLYAQCHVGVVALDPRHRTHNIPGKFLSYMQCGLPVLASINPGNDLVELIEREGVGRASVDSSVTSLQRSSLSLLEDIESDQDMSMRCRRLAGAMFSPEAAVRQIVMAVTT